MPISVDA